MVICCIAFTAAAAWAFWAPTPIETLATESDCIVIGTVKQLVKDTNTHRVLVTVQGLTPLKGEKLAGTSVTFDAPYSLNNDVIFMNQGQRQFPFDSFRTNEACAVFLKRSHEQKPGLRLVQDDDGKFIIDWGLQTATRGLKITSPDSVPLKEFMAKITPKQKVPITSLPPTAPHVPAR
jgi:hypothetical protein